MRNENKNEKWEKRIELWINKKIFFYWFVKPIITGLTGKKVCKKQKKIILKKKLPSIINKTKKL